MKYLKAVWQFCSYLFWPRWGARRARRMKDEGRRMRVPRFTARLGAKASEKMAEG